MKIKRHLEADSAQLKQLIGSERTAQNVKIVEDGLNSKWEGVQSIAVRVLGSWGDRKSKQRLHEFLVECQPRKWGWAIRGVIVQELAKCVTARDAEWVLDRYFSLQDYKDKHEFLPVACALPSASARKRIIKEMTSPDKTNYRAAETLIWRLDFSDTDRDKLLERYLSDADHALWTLAGALGEAFFNK